LSYTNVLLHGPEGVSMENELELLKRLFENLEAPAYIMDHNGHILMINNVGIRMYQTSREEFFRNYADSQEMVRRGLHTSTIFEQVMAKKEAVSGWTELYDANQNRSLFYASQRPIFDSDGNIKYVVGTNILYKKFDKMVQQLQAKKIKQELHLVSSESHSLLYCSKAMERVVHSLQRVAGSDANILIQGETGTGKDVIANYIHSISPRSKRDMISLNCAAISSSLFEAELFGYEAGSFTGAKTKGSPGLIESAQGSTLFLDEVDSIPLECQGKLLRAIETKRIRRVGGTKPIEVDFRLIIATNKDLNQLVTANKFREDLYYRLNVFNVFIPPLRERKDDIRLLTNFFLERYCAQYDTQKTFSEDVYRQLEEYDWPGNVRELKNMIERAVLASDIDTTELKYIHIPNAGSKRPDPALSISASTQEHKTLADGISLEARIDEYEKELLQDAMRQFDSITKAASYLNVSISTLSRKMAKYGIKR